MEEKIIFYPTKWEENEEKIKLQSPNKVHKIVAFHDEKTETRKDLSYMVEVENDNDIRKLKKLYCFWWPFKIKVYGHIQITSQP